MRKAFKSVRAVLAAALAGVALSTVTATPAQADGWCNPGYFCAYQDNDEGGWAVRVRDGGSVPRLVEWQNDGVSSVWNRTDNQWCLFEHQDYKGRLLESVPPGAKYNLPMFDSDKTSSLFSCIL
ncbi:peptidase inhibitor family I36 protein [Streptomyces sp. NPDC059564]|uniref:peptidase inhibitor family I36 protein n=1 Tax=Streptomyces sp. NPDC059564 TaxID=3346865 RepID=UPI0036746BFA